MKTIVFKLYKSKRNRHLEDALFLSAEIWNHCIALHRSYYRLTGKHLSAYKLKLHLTKLKRQNRFSHWNNLGSQVIQDIAERIDRSYNAFFYWVKYRNCPRKSIPKFKKKSKYNSFTLKQAGYRFEGEDTLFLMGRRYRYHKNRPIEGKIKTITLKRDSLGDFYLYVVTDARSNEVLPRTGHAVGLDFGLRTFLTASDGSEVASPLFYKQHEHNIKRLSKSLSTKQKGSGNRRRAKRDLALEHRKITRQRNDFHRKLSQDLASEYAIVCVEALSLSGMKSLWGKKVSDLGFHSFTRILEEECGKTGSRLVKVSRTYPSTQLCSVCGYKNGELKDLGIRKWTCPQCGIHHFRDVNSAINLKKEGQRLTS